MNYYFKAKANDQAYNMRGLEELGKKLGNTNIFLTGKEPDVYLYYTWDGSILICYNGGKLLLSLITTSSEYEEIKVPKKEPKFKIGNRVVCPTSEEEGNITKITYLPNAKEYMYEIIEKDTNCILHIIESKLELSKEIEFKIGDYVVYIDKGHAVGQIVKLDYPTVDVLLLNQEVDPENDLLVGCMINGYPLGTMVSNIIPWKPQRGENVLVRDFKDDKWDEGIFSYYDNDEDKFVLRGGVMYEYCIPFDVNKLGKVTD